MGNREVWRKTTRMNSATTPREQFNSLAPTVDANSVAVNSVAVNTVDVYGAACDSGNDMTLDTPISLRARFAKNLRNSRATQEVSQEALADLAGVHRTFVSEVERGIRNLSIDNIEKLAIALKLDPSELFKP